ncbi:peptidase%2C U32 family [Streptococcus pneumoniae]|nr:U32 family peptidase C-terminal domain-containing protein [Streptococcus pneumoniae]CJM74352.1 peptidase%2C U32 family [Streptococcus pneumoniae]
MRDANRGGYSQSCRWKYDLYDMPFGKERKSLQGEIPEEFSMSAVDMSMIDHIPDMIENGVDSLKIEGRMKSIHYVSTVTNCYKAAVDAYLESPEKFEAIKQDLVDEMWKVAQRELATGFYYGTPSENEQLFGARRKIPEYKFVAEMVSYDDAAQTATIRQRNVINEGDQVEFYGPGFRHFETYIEDLHDAKGNKIDRAPNPMELLTIKVPQPMPFGKERKSLQGEIPEEFSMSAVDMSMIDHIPDMIENGVDSLKIEGRMKSIHYVSTVTNCYKAAVDAYLESPEKFEAIKQDLVDEMWKVAQRELATGFYYGTPSENEQLFGARRKIPEYKFVAEVVSYDDAAQTATIRQRNVINEGDQVEFYGPGFRHFETYIEDLHDAKGNKIDRAPNPMELLTIKVPQPVQSGDMVRALKEGLINLYKEDGTSVTVRA